MIDNRPLGLCKHVDASPQVHYAPASSLRAHLGVDNNDDQQDDVGWASFDGHTESIYALVRFYFDKEKIQQHSNHNTHGC